MLEASLGAAQRHKHLILFPVIAEKGRTLPYILLQDALSSGTLTIGEVGEGSVPTLEAKNDSLLPVLILDGEQLLGAKQNRITNRSLLLAPKSVTPIPVSCMEQGRWNVVSDTFAPAPHHAPSKVRRRAREVEANQQREAGHASHRDLSAAQGAVWDEIREYGDALKSHSPTGAMDAVFQDQKPQMDAYIDAFPPIDHQIGLLAFSGLEVLGLDALGSSELYLGLHRRLLTGYVMDALRAKKPKAERPTERDALSFVDQVREARRVSSESVGAGEYRILQGDVLGGELVDGAQLVHLSSFPLLEQGSRNGEERSGPDGFPILGPRQRRMRY